MKNLKVTWIILLAIVLSIGIVACSKEKETKGDVKVDPETPPASTTAPKTDPEPQTSEKFEITMLDYRYGALPPEDGPGLQMINEKFNVDWKPTYISRSDYQTKVTVTVAGGGMPDIVILENAMDPLYYKWAAEGAFLPLDEYIDDYDFFDLIPEHVIKGTQVNGQLYGLPGYTTSLYSITPMIRTDWLENLGLSMPTNYDELKAVALAFTNDDPNQNGKNDTYGMAMAENINPQYHLGSYWDFLAWYHKDQDGNYIPGIISDVRKNHIAWLKDLYAQGAITQDFALLTWDQAYKEFFGGKAGIFITTPKGLSKDYLTAITKLDPDVKLAPIPPFVDPDGNQGFTASAGTLRIVMLNAKLKDQPEKVKRILEIINYPRVSFFTDEQKNPDNPDFDWLNGGEGSGYTMVDGVAVLAPGEDGMKPIDYLTDAAGWAPNDAANNYSKNFQDNQVHYDMVVAAAEMHDTTKHFYSPVVSLYTPAKQEYELDLYFLMYAEQTKMITGQTPLEDWDKMLQLYMDKGGAVMIKEVNDAIKEIGAEAFWQ